jgi:flavin reductase ActVB
MEPAERLDEAFREAMSRLAAGVVMVTTRLDGEPWGVTVSSCCSVSTDPPTVLVSLSQGTAAAKAIRGSGSYGVSLMSQRSIGVARFGAVRGAPKWLGAYCASVETRSPVVASALAHLDIDVTNVVPVADHDVFIGRVVQVTLAHPDEPLLYFARSYRALAAPTPADPFYVSW